MRFSLHFQQRCPRVGSTCTAYASGLNFLRTSITSPDGQKDGVLLEGPHMHYICCDMIQLTFIITYQLLLTVIPQTEAALSRPVPSPVSLYYQWRRSEVESGGGGD